MLRLSIIELSTVALVGDMKYNTLQIEISIIPPGDKLLGK